MTDLPLSMATLQRLPTGIAGLDQILHGGLFVGGSYLVIGPTGTGKTILANHISFNTAARHERVLFLSLFTEQHAQMFAYLRAFTFFNPAVLGQEIVYLSAYAIFEAEGWQGLLTYLRQEVRRQQATLVVLDGVSGFMGAEYGPMTPLRFLHDLQTFIYAMQATLLFTTLGDAQLTPSLEHMLVDGILTLDEPRTLDPVYADLIIKKFRGSPFARGAHRFEILPTGIAVTPMGGERMVSSGP
jgi:circadian clock protein KaiC